MPGLPEGLTTRPLQRSDAHDVFVLMAAQEHEDIGHVAIEEADIVSDWAKPSHDLRARSIGVWDGDTLVVAGERVRIANIDTPEMPPKARCAAEADGALRARDRLQALVASGPVELERTGTDRYGRTLARVSIDGADAGNALVAAGLARPWEGRRRSWCA